MTEATDPESSHLPPAAGRLGAVFARPKWLAAFCVIALTALGWLGARLACVSGMGALAETLVPAAPGGVVWGVSGFALVGADVGRDGAGDDAAERGADDPHLRRNRRHRRAQGRAGRLAVRAGRRLHRGLARLCGRRDFRAIAFTRPRWLDSGMASASGLFSGAIFIGAGVYQFSALKHACLTQCQNPFPFFFANWATTPRGVFRLGVKQGLYCLGCCWAMMLVMFAVGVMNVVWMAALGMRDDGRKDRHRPALHLCRGRCADRRRRGFRGDGVVAIGRRIGLS